MSNTPDEIMTVDLELDDGRNVSCEVITVLEVEEKDYIVLLPEGQDPESEESEVWFYQLKEDPDDENAEPELIYIEDEEEYEKVADAFDEFLDEMEFEALNEE